MDMKEAQVLLEAAANNLYESQPCVRVIGSSSVAQQPTIQLLYLDVEIPFDCKEIRRAKEKGTIDELVRSRVKLVFHD